MIEIKVPSPGESITQVQLSKWLVSDGDAVEKDQEIAEIDSDKATLSVSAEEDGKIKFLVSEGDTVDVGAVIATIETGVKGEKKTQDSGSKTQDISKKVQEEVPAKKPIETEIKSNKVQENVITPVVETHLNISPLAKKLMQQNNVSESDFLNLIKSYRIGKKDVELFLSQKDKPAPATAAAAATAAVGLGGARETERKKMSTLRLKLAEKGLYR